MKDLLSESIYNSGLSRRAFLTQSAKLAGSASLLGTVGSFQRALAAGTTADTTGYKALVCVYLDGGNNGFNTLVPTTQAGYNTYAASRSNLALSRSSLLSLSGTASDGYAYGLNAACPELRTLFNSGRLAVLGNVGTLVQPTTKAQALSGLNLPLQLFSHIDQRTAWWTSLPDQPARLGWGGRIADLYDAQGYRTPLAMNINIGGVNYWQEGGRVMPYVLGPKGAPELFPITSTYRNGLRQQATRDLLNQAASHPNLLVAELAALENSAISKVDVVNSALAAAGDVSTAFPAFLGDQELGAQLRAVARCIKAHEQIGDARQIFFVNFGGFDTHNNELNGQAERLQILSKNLKSFWDALNEIGEQNNVTVFTASDFGRGLGSNGDGSDHAWGNHQFILGGAVRGGSYYGAMPSLALGSDDDIGVGRIIPTTSTDQYGATLARWFGVPDAALNTVFPNLPNFGARRDLGFFL